MESLSHSLAVVSVIFLPILFALTGREIARAYTAYFLGDKTAFQMGRLSLNPLSHVDPLGTVVVPVLCYILLSVSGSVPIWFGWAKPIPIELSRLKKGGRYGYTAVAFSGPVCNLFMAFLWAFFWRFLSLFYEDSNFWIQVSGAAIGINAVFLAFNLIPLLPFDGGQIIESLLPLRWALPYRKTEHWGGIFILFVLILGAVTGFNFIYFWISPFYNAVWGLVRFLFFS